MERHPEVDESGQNLKLVGSVQSIFSCLKHKILGYYMLKEHYGNEELAWEVFLQGLDVTSGGLVNGARKECENPLTISLDPCRLGPSHSCI